MLSILGFTKLIKGYFSHTGCPKKENWLILVQKRRYLDMIKILGFLKSFFFVMLSILEAFFQIWINQAKKKAYFSHTWCPKIENELILVKN